MKPITFPQCNVKIAENQDEYLTLPAHHAGDIQGTVTTCWELSPDEIEEVRKTGKIYLQLWTFNQPVQPIQMHTTNPLES